MTSPLEITVENTSATVYFEQGEPVAISFQLPRKSVEWYDLKKKNSDDIIRLIRSIKNENQN